MTLLLILLIVLSTVTFAAIFLLGFRLGSENWRSELAKVRLQAIQAERQLHNLTREAFTTMAEVVEQRRAHHP